MIPEKKLDKVRFASEVKKLRSSDPSDKLWFFDKNSIKVAKNALDPILRLDFKKLVDVHDHEEGFLRDHFYRGLARSYVARIKDGSVDWKIKKSDVRNAMIFVGTAAETASTSQFRDTNKSVLVSICPYCV